MKTDISHKRPATKDASREHRFIMRHSRVMLAYNRLAQVLEDEVAARLFDYGALEPS